MTPNELPSQVDRFKETARKLGCNDDEMAFDEKLKGIARSVRPPQSGPTVAAEVARDMVKDPSRITETDLVVPALRVAAEAGGFIRTSDLIAKLEEIFEPDGKDQEIVENRSDTFFSQKVRNLVSHRKSNFIASGYANHDQTRKGIEITDEGRTLLKSLGYKA